MFKWVFGNSNKIKLSNNMQDFLPHYFFVETQAQVNDIMALNPKGSQVKRTDFSIERLQLTKYLAGIIEGDPELALFGELASPIIQRGKGAKSMEAVLSKLKGFQYVVPAPFYGVLEGWNGMSSNQLPKWQYSVHLLSTDRASELTLVFRVPTLLGEQELRDYITEHADWSLAQEFSF